MCFEALYFDVFLNDRKAARCLRHVSRKLPLFSGLQRVSFRLLLLVKWAQMVQTYIIGTVEEFQSSTSSSINKIKDKDGNVTSDPNKMSNIFNDFYVNVADSITKSIPMTPKSPLDYLSNRTGNSLFLTPVTLMEVNDLISILNPSKSVGPNSIPIKLLKIIGSSVSQFLALLVNQSFQSGIFPDKLKIAKVISLFKKGNPETPSNYRLISLLPIFSKIFEKPTYRRLYRFLGIHKVLYSL